MKTVTASDANRHFSQILKSVSRGEAVTVVSRGTAVAQIIPAQPAGGGENARQRLVERLHSQPATGTRDWRRDELYD
jgi:prevent-host-death family protein